MYEEKLKGAKRRAKTETIAGRRFRRVLENMFVWGTETKEQARAKQLFGKGHYRKFNGACTCRVCQMNRPKYDRAKEKQKRLKDTE